MPHTKLTRLALAAAAVLIITAALRAGEGDWPRFRGPNGQGISDATTVPAKWTADDYNWKVKLPGSGHSSPVLWGDRIFLTCSDAETAKRMIVCLKSSDGSKVWQRDFESKTYAQNDANSFASSTPAADAGGIVVTWSTPEEITLLALDSGGKDVWRRNLGPLVAKHGSGQSPIILGDLVILANDQEDLNRMLMIGGPPSGKRAAGKSSLIALDRKTGQTRWQIERQTALAAYSTPCVYQPEGGRPEIIFSSTAHGITAVDPATGKVSW
ncbi:MAG: PQQ-binding-like beta-propeller repeat protein, partial [Planctomycetota bacterium]|nr:PQQ-binding-like beta-propeller repeat protein [Planctomycetota bacterium]